MKKPNKESSDFVYLRIATVIEQQILNEILCVGDKLPSLRTIAREYGVSQNTALNVYYYLERKMLIESKPQSGYYVRYSKSRVRSLLKTTTPEPVANYADAELLVSKVYENLGAEGYLPLALGTPANELLPITKLNKEMLAATRELKGSGVSYDKTEGNERLRRQIARWAFAMECNFTQEDIITTGGCLNALSYCMMAITKRGDTVAMESPVSFGMLRLAQSLGLKVLELPTDPQTGIDLNAFEDALKKLEINVCLFISNFSNPLGSCMPDENKKQIVRLIEKYNIPLIENDLNGDVYFGQQRPKSCKTYDESGLVLWCGSVSKTLAPGYRVGWVAAGRYREQVRKMKLYHQISSASITQEVIGRFLETGRYENHLRKLRQTLHANMIRYSNAIADYFPVETMASRPQGGFVIWVALPSDINTFELYEEALHNKVSFAPGRIFTLQNQYDNCMRLNYGLSWSTALEENLKLLGSIIQRSRKHN